MTIRRSLLSFALGVVCTALFALANSWGLQKQYEMEAWQHGAGYFEVNVFDNRCIWHWWN